MSDAPPPPAPDPAEGAAPASPPPLAGWLEPPGGWIEPTPTPPPPPRAEPGAWVPPPPTGAWQVPPSAPPPPPPAAAVVRPDRGRLLVIAIALLIALGAGGVAYKRANESSYPSSWDARVKDLVDFDQQHRGLQYKHPVPIDFLTTDEYAQRTRSDSSKVTDEQRKQLETTEGELRAMGLVAGKVDLFAAGNDLADNGTLAFYDPDAKRIVVRGTEMTPGLRVTLVHELVHVLQDQWFDISSKRLQKLQTSQEESAFHAMVEGDAVRIEQQYLDTLSDDDRATAEKQTSQSPDDTSLDSVPVALQAVFQAPYVLGGPLVQLMASDGGNDAVNDLLRTPPTTDRELLDPRALKDHIVAVSVDEPSLPAGVTGSTDDGDFGALALYLVLAERIDPARALDAVDGWAGDAYVAYQQDGRTCLAVAVAGVDDPATAMLRSALGDWAANMPAGAAQVGEQGSDVLVRSCDPGDAATTNDRALDALQLPALRLDGVFEAVDQGGLGIDDGFEFGDCVAHGLSFDQLQKANSAASAAELPPDLLAAITATYQTCAAQVRG